MQRCLEKKAPSAGCYHSDILPQFGGKFGVYEIGLPEMLSTFFFEILGFLAFFGLNFPAKAVGRPAWEIPMDQNPNPWALGIWGSQCVGRKGLTEAAKTWTAIFFQSQSGGPKHSSLM